MPNEKSETLSLTCPSDLAGSRLDQVLAALLPMRSRSFLKKTLNAGGVIVAGKAAKPSLKLRGGESLVIYIPEAVPLLAEAEDLPLEVLYEDGDLVVINKPPNMVAHPSQGHHSGTLVNALLHHYSGTLSGIGGVLRPGIVHRLDKDTSGCLVAAKNDATHHRLIEQFMDRTVEKFYLAVTDGVPRPATGKVEGNTGRSKNDRKIHAMLKTGGRHSLTFYETLENYGALALVKCELKTGRTHQARVHLAHLGSPVLCDRDYGRREIFTSADLEIALELFRRGVAPKSSGMPSRILLKRQALHAWRLAFTHPRDGRRLEFEAALPSDILAVLEPFRKARREMSD